MKFEESKKYITEKAKELQACSEEYKKALQSKNFGELIEVIRNNYSWVIEEKLLNDELSVKYFGVTLLSLLNSGAGNAGYWNSGDRNSGDRNSGNWNSGNRNSGDWNSGYRNSGDWNSGDRNSGFFNTSTPDIINIFNKPCKHEDWEGAEKPGFIYRVLLTEWILFDDMTDEEKKQWSKAYICNGYLKQYTYKDAWKIAFDKASEGDIELLKALPNFDAKVFEEITGIKIK